MIEIVDKHNCTGCAACMNICAHDCICMKEDEYGFTYPIINKEKCIDCGLCNRICPVQEKHNVMHFDPVIYACQNINEDVRLQSSSGGLFSDFSEYILEVNGIVYGAGINMHYEVCHKKISSVDCLNEIRGSKYLQSKIGLCYRNIKNELNSDKIVLFSGTGCQIAGLKSYLKKDYKNLFCIEIVCHGVPSERVFRKYINEIESKYNSHVTNINFRDKRYGWNNYNVTITFENGDIISEQSMENDFMNGYINNLYLRPSCKKCKFKCMSSGSDILLGDFWGVNDLGEPWNDNKGTSVVFINTQNGLELFEKVKQGLIIREVNLDFAIRFNPCIIKPISNSNDIYEYLDKMDLHEIVQKYSPKVEKISFMKKLKNKLRRCFIEK